MPDTWIVLRIDGRGFHRISTRADFEKPNDAKALALMNKAAEGVLRDVGGVVLGYGYSDEYSGSMNAREAEDYLKRTLARDKHEILYSKFGINYNKEPDIFKKGSIIYWDTIRAGEMTTVESQDPDPNAPTVPSPARLGGETTEDPVTRRGDSSSEEAYHAPTREQSHGKPHLNGTSVKRRQRKKEKKTVMVSHVDVINGDADFWKEGGPGWKIVNKFD
ncbi:MAG: tRNA-His guanylyltransferase [Alyxoria varia]|nr:MAG: tRNA-His guanylyltransferase [Alyxoria varia]